MASDKRPAWKSLRTRYRAMPGKPIAVPSTLLPPKLSGVAAAAAAAVAAAGPVPAANVRQLYAFGGVTAYSSGAGAAAGATSDEATGDLRNVLVQARAARQTMYDQQHVAQTQRRLSRDAFAARVQEESARKRNQLHAQKLKHAKSAIPDVDHMYSISPKMTLGRNEYSTRLILPDNHSFVVGKIDFWRPFCSHRNCILPTNLCFSDHTGDLCFVTGPNAANPYLYAVLFREMGLCVMNTTADVFTDGEVSPNVRALFSRSDHAIGNALLSCNKDVVQRFIHEALDAAVRAELVTVRWETMHYEGASNPTGALSMFHPVLTSTILGDESFSNVIKATRDWRRECSKRMKSIDTLDETNCCRLRAWISLNPSSFGSNNVRVAADLATKESPYWHHATLDGCPPREAPPKHTVGAGIVSSSDCRVLAHLLSYVDFANFTACPLSLKPTTFLPKLFDTSMMSTMYRGTHKADSEQVARVEAVYASKDVLISDRNGQKGQQNLWSIEGILSSPLFTVSQGYSGGAASQPTNVSLSLRRYQLETLQWMEDQERRPSISDPFWVKLTMLSQVKGKLAPKWQPFWYCPLTGHLALTPPPRIQGGILSEEMGLGKTVEVIALVCNSMADASRRPAFGNGTPADPLHAKTTLIVTPVSLLKQWETELKRRTNTNLTVCTWYGSGRPKDPRKIAMYDVCLTTYSTMASKHTDGVLHSVNFYRTIIDESTYVKGGASTGVYTMLMRIPSPRRWAVSGTPFANHLRSLEPIMRFLGVSPWANGTSFAALVNQFTARQCGTGNTLTYPGDLGSMPMPTLAYLLKSLLMRHVKAQRLNGTALIDMPRATGRMVEVTLSAAERVAYARAEAEALANAKPMLTSEAVVKASIIALHALLRPVRKSCAGLIRTPNPSVPETAPKAKPAYTMTTLSGAAPKAKPAYTTTTLPGAAKIIRLIADIRQIRQRDPGAKFVIFSEFDSLKQAANSLLNAAGILVKTLYGSMAATTRGKVLSSFAEDADQVALILSGRFAHGLTLTCACVVVRHWCRPFLCIRDASVCIPALTSFAFVHPRRCMLIRSC
jgi:SNF2-related domain